MRPACYHALNNDQTDSSTHMASTWTHTYKAPNIIRHVCSGNAVVGKDNDNNNVGMTPLPVLGPSEFLYREENGFVEVGEKLLPNEIRWRPYIKIGAKVGDEWKDKGQANLSETYKLTRLAVEELPVKKLVAGDEALCAVIERRTVTPGFVEEVHFARGVGPIARIIFEIRANERRERWFEALVPDADVQADKVGSSEARLRDSGMGGGQERSHQGRATDRDTGNTTASFFAEFPDSASSAAFQGREITVTGVMSSATSQKDGYRIDLKTIYRGAGAACFFQGAAANDAEKANPHVPMTIAGTVKGLLFPDRPFIKLVNCRLQPTSPVSAKAVGSVLPPVSNFLKLIRLTASRQEAPIVTATRLTYLYTSESPRTFSPHMRIGTEGMKCLNTSARMVPLRLLRPTTC